MCNKHCADDVEFPECSDTQHKEQKVCVKCIRRSPYCTVCPHSAKCNQSWSFHSHGRCTPKSIYNEDYLQHVDTAIK